MDYLVETDFNKEKYFTLPICDPGEPNAKREEP
jgi:hypothetical protein